MKERIEIHNTREELKKYLDDSRLNDSRKYIINQETPQFAIGQKSPNKNSKLTKVEEFVAEISPQKCKIFQNEIHQKISSKIKKADITIIDVKPPAQ